MYARVQGSMTRQIDSAESTTNSATSSAADPVTTNTFQQPADAVTFSSTPASQWASCKQDNQKNRPRDALQMARDVTEPSTAAWILRRPVRPRVDHLQRVLARGRARHAARDHDAGVAAPQLA